MSAQSPLWLIGDVLVDTAAMTLRRPGEPERQIPLKPLKLLQLLIESPGEVVPYTAIDTAVWNQSAMLNNSVHSLVRQLRSLFQCSRQARYIHNARGVGYRLCQPVSRVERSPFEERTGVGARAALPSVSVGPIESLSQSDQVVDSLGSLRALLLHALWGQGNSPFRVIDSDSAIDPQSDLMITGTALLSEEGLRVLFKLRTRVDGHLIGCCDFELPLDTWKSVLRQQELAQKAATALARFLSKPH